MEGEKMMNTLNPQPRPLAEGSSVQLLLVDYAQIPEDFKGFLPNNIHSKVQAHWFYKGLSSEQFSRISPKEGINKDHAWKHLHTIQTSFDIGHNLKTAQVAYLLSKWFDVPEDLLNEVTT
jgi:hypothetical protein